MITGGPWGHDTITGDAGLEREWLLTNGLGGYAMGTLAGGLTRGYHSLLTVAERPPRQRVRLLAGLLTTIVDGYGECPLWMQEWAPGVLSPAGEGVLWRFWLENGQPVWEYQCRGIWLRYRLVMPFQTASVVLAWEWQASYPVTIHITPLVSGRDHHRLGSVMPSWEWGNDGFRANWPHIRLSMRIPGMDFHPRPLPYYHFYYRAEAERGLSASEDLWSAGRWVIPLAAGRGRIRGWAWANDPEPDGDREWEAEQRRRSALVQYAQAVNLPPGLALAADSFRVSTITGQSTVMAGYPWFTDWGRDTFIALPGLAWSQPEGLRWGESVIYSWADLLTDGLLPNRFLDEGEVPDWSSADTVLWWILRIWNWGRRMTASRRQTFWQSLLPAVDEALAHLAAGTRFGIGADGAGWLRLADPNRALTWMDARIGDWAVTPRSGYPVEMNALWINALTAHDSMARQLGQSSRWASVADHLAKAFGERFRHPEGEGLADVIRLDGSPDPAIRPNQLLALALPRPLVGGDMAARIMRTVETRLLTPIGLYSLSPGDPAFRSRFTGPPEIRDQAYHQGAIWPFWLGAYIDAWRAVDPEEAYLRAKTLWPIILTHLDEAGVGSMSEVMDPTTHRGRGCPFQAWSVAEAIRLAVDYGAATAH